jgi:oligopeptidase B
VEQFEVASKDGEKIPYFVIMKKDAKLDGKNPTLLYGYGGFEISQLPGYSGSIGNGWLAQGGVYVVANIRGGGEFGRPWYEAGKLAKKVATFRDFLACAEELIRLGWTSADRLAAMGGSAGGLLMGAVCNMRPELFRAVVAEVPFVDVLNTMSDATLPLTTQEWDEWGNPAVSEQYQWIRAYSPYDNVQSNTDYPELLVTAGLNDPRVPYWEPAKWVQKLRDVANSSRPILFRVHLGAGHGGSSGRYKRWREVAENYAFILDRISR